MANMDYITRSQMQHKNMQVLTSFDWDYNIDFGAYVGFHPPMDQIKRCVNTISGDCDSPLPTLDIMTVPLRGFTIHQPGLTDQGSRPGPIMMAGQDFEDQSLFAWWYDWLNRANSVQNRAYRRESLFVDIDLWRLNSTRVRVLQIHYYDCLPAQAPYENSFNDGKAPVGQIQMTFQPEWRLVTLLNI